MSKQAETSSAAPLRKRVQELETELQSLYAELSRAQSRQTLPGQYLILEAAEHACALSAHPVQELVRLVAYKPVPGAPPFILGTLLYRGTAVLAVDLARLLFGKTHEPSLESHMVVLGGSRPLALVVDRVRSLVDSPTLVTSNADVPDSEVWRSNSLVAGFCLVGEEHLPLLGLGAIAHAVEGVAG